MVTDSSVYLGDAILNWIKSSAFPSDPANVYASLWNGDPDAAGTEVTGTVNLTRQAITFGAISSRAMSNSGDISFGTANASATVTYVAIYDSGTAGMGNEICKKLVSTASITNGLAVKILTGNLTLSY
jgi:hypothetical protein